MKKFIATLLAFILIFALTVPAVTAQTSQSGNTVIITNGTDVTIGSAYGEDEKLWLRWAPCGPNSLMQLYTISKSGADSDLPENQWLSSGTDWVGPVLMKAREADDSTGIYAGGWHKREDGSASAKTESIVVKVDGVEQTGSVTMNGSKVEIIVTNELFVGTTAATSKSGMREVVHYTISGNVVDVETTLTAINDVTITQYFGLQGVTRTYTADMIQFVNGQENSYVGSYYTHVSGTKADYPDVNAVIHCNEAGDKMTMTLDRTYGLGTLDYLPENNHIATHASTSKTYFNLVNGTHCEVDAGDSVGWKGQYAFEKAPVSETVLADYNALTRASLGIEAMADATLTSNLTLPQKGVNGSTILWKSSNREIISDATGVVKTPELATSVTLTATIFDGEGASMEKAFAFRVAGAEGPVDSSGAAVMPQKDKLIRQDNFDDNTIDATAITSVVGNVEEANGVLHFSRLNDDGTDMVSATIYAKADKTPVYGSSLTEFTITKNSTYTGITTYVFGDKGQICQLSIGANKNFSVYYSGGSKALTPTEVGTDTLQFKLAYESGTGTFRLWLNDKFICKEKSLSAAGGLSHLYFLQSKATGLATDVNLDDLAFYSAKSAGLTKYVDEFDDGVMAKNIAVTTSGTNTVKEENGVLKVGTSAASASSVAINLNEDGSPVTGKIALEFQVKRTACSHALDFYVNGSDKKMIVQGRLWNSALHGYWADTEGGAKVTHTTNSVANDKMGIYLEINTNTKQFSVWMNGALLGSGYSLGATDVTSVSFAAFDTSCDPVVEYFRYTNLSDEYEKSIGQYVDSFGDSTLSNRVELSNMELKDGSLIVTDRTKTSGATVYLNEDKSAVTGNFTVEFSTSRALNYATTDFHIFGTDGNRYTTIRWWSIGNANYASVEHRIDATSNKTTATYKLNSEVGSQNSMRVKIAFNTDKQTFSVWINGHEIARDVLSSYGADSVAYVSLQNVYAANSSYTGTGYGNAAMHDFAYYTPMPGLGLSAYSLDYNAYDKKVSVASPIDGEAVVIVASYCGDKMISAVPTPVTLQKNDDVLADTSKLNVTGADRVSLFLWDGLDTIEPLIEKTLLTSGLTAN